ncbi:MAG: amino acid transporter [Acidimicrobiia bacterium]|nr:amino acid transporter [Acidimicrobiia bacterium]
MPENQLRGWEPLALGSTIELFEAAPFRWWISGGNALDLHLDRSWRQHGDTDVGVCRNDVTHLVRWLSGWDVQIASAGRLQPWRPSSSRLAGNNLWCRSSTERGWQLDITVGEGNEHRWVYRRDPTITVAWCRAVLRTERGAPYLAPEIQLLFKSKSVRPKDRIDAEAVIPMLDPDRLGWLSAALPPEHSWQRLISDASTLRR